jgi:hypothetical protein
MIFMKYSRIQSSLTEVVQEGDPRAFAGAARLFYQWWCYLKAQYAGSAP